jgi:hypothetical protein
MKLNQSLGPWMRGEEIGLPKFGEISVGSDGSLKTWVKDCKCAEGKKGEE